MEDPTLLPDPSERPPDATTADPQVVAAPRSSSAEALVAQTLAAGEQVYLSIECLRRSSGEGFERTIVAVTDQHLLEIRPIFPWGYELFAAHPRGACRVVNGRERPDGSRLLIVRHESGPLCLFFQATQGSEADQVFEALGYDPAPPPRTDAPPLTVVPDPPEVDRFAMAQEFSGILEALDESAEDEG